MNIKSKEPGRSRVSTPADSYSLAEVSGDFVHLQLTTSNETSSILQQQRIIVFVTVQDQNPCLLEPEHKMKLEWNVKNGEPAITVQDMLDATFAKQSLRNCLELEDPAQSIEQHFKPPRVKLCNDPDLGMRSLSRGKEDDGNARAVFVDLDEPVVNGGEYSVVLIHKQQNKNIGPNVNAIETGEEPTSWYNVEPSSAISSWTHDRAIRERNKSLRRIYEDEEMDYGEDVKTKKQLTFREDVAVNLRKVKVGNMVKLMKAARNLDLCFLVDATGSMRPYINSVKTSIRSIVDKLTSKDGNMKAIVKKIRLAFVGYRDFGNGAKQFEVLPFTSSVDEFQQFCEAIKPIGNQDTAEDVFGGLEKMIGLDWSVDGSTHMLFHIADAPCHGREFHDLREDIGQDKFPNGDPEGRSILTLLDQLAEKQIQYHFGKITRWTDKMIEKFSELLDGEIVVCDLANSDKVFENVVSTSSIAVTAGRAIRRRKQKIEFDKSMPNWCELPKVSGVLCAYQMPNSFNTIVLGFPLVGDRPIKATIQIAEKPFAAGAERLAFYGRDVSDPAKSVDIVLKKYIDKVGNSNPSAPYESAIQMQTIAAFLAELFNNFLRKIGTGHAIKFLKTQMLSYADFSNGKVFMSCEKRYPIEHDYLRFTNNLDYAMLEMTANQKGVDMQFVEQLFAFSHWTYHITCGYLMVVDLQGIISKGPNGEQAIELTDPAIHCTDLTRFGRTNLGESGMKGFFSRHKCNEICKQMGLVIPEKFANQAEDDD